MADKLDFCKSTERTVSTLDSLNLMTSIHAQRDVFELVPFLSLRFLLRQKVQIQYDNVISSKSIASILQTDT